MKDYILEVLKKELGHAVDNLYRANLAFGGLSADEMQKEHGNSGETRQQILDTYKKAHDRVLLAIEWLENI